MTTKRRNHSAQFKFKVACEAMKNEKTRAQIASEYGVQGTQISQWKKKLMEDGKGLFERKNSRQEKEWKAQETALYEQIGRLKMELEWLKKKSEQIS